MRFHFLERQSLRKHTLTDITIPYDEIGDITAVGYDGKKTVIIKDGRFVLDGTKELNEPFIS